MEKETEVSLNTGGEKPIVIMIGEDHSDKALSFSVLLQMLETLKEYRYQENIEIGTEYPANNLNELEINVILLHSVKYYNNFSFIRDTDQLSPRSSEIIKNNNTLSSFNNKKK